MALKRQTDRQKKKLMVGTTNPFYEEKGRKEGRKRKAKKEEGERKEKRGRKEGRGMEVAEERGREEKKKKKRNRKARKTQLCRVKWKVHFILGHTLCH